MSEVESQPAPVQEQEPEAPIQTIEYERYKISYRYLCDTCKTPFPLDFTRTRVRLSDGLCGYCYRKVNPAPEGLLWGK